MYPNESSRVLVYCLRSHNMLDWYVYMRLWKYIWLYEWNLSCSSLPYFCCCVLLCGTLFCDDHQLIDVSKCVEHLWTTGRWWFRRIVPMAHLLVCPWIYMLFVKLFIQFSFGHRGVPWIVRSWVLNSKTALLCYLYCDASFNFVY